MSEAKDPTERFGNRADIYERYRPRYPVTLLEFLKQRLGLGPGLAVADLGAGTGLLTELLVQSGAKVYAVEPNDPMRARCAAKLSGRAEVIKGTAEQTGLPDGVVDLVVAAQAFHWFDPTQTRAEVKRIGKPGCGGALVWNERIEEGDFMADYLKLLQTWERERGASTARDELLPAIERFFGGAGRFSEVRFDNAQTLDREGLIGRIFSSSYMPGPEDPDHAPARAAAESMFDTHQVEGVVQLRYACKVYFDAP